MSTLIRLRDFRFLLFDVLDCGELLKSPRYAEHDEAMLLAVLEMAQTVAQNEFEPFAARLDQTPPEWVDGEIILIEEMHQAMKAFVDTGLLSAAFDEDVGGLQLPYAVSCAAMSFFDAANISAIGYPFLTMAAAQLLAHHGSEELKTAFLPPMLDGRYYGTMCLSEPHAGSALGNIRTTARPLEDGRYAIKGTKMWISAADHQLGENIIHLVLAKLPDAPAGVRGISLFLVPKTMPETGERNEVHVVGLNHKMGYTGTVNTVLEFGENKDCTGFIIGQPNDGLRIMFSMMNEARIGVGIGAAALGYAGLRYSLEYAKERPQGQRIGERDPEAEPVMIIEHADVRRMLLAQKALSEGGLALGLYAARLVDEEFIARDLGEDAGDVSLLLGLLTPIVKAWCSDFCLDANTLAIQVLGGYGYTRDYPVERIYRDNRLNSIHEGTNGIQALDLLGRKIPMQNGAALKILMARIAITIGEAQSIERTKPWADALALTLKSLGSTTQALGGLARQGQHDLSLSNATAYLHFMGHTVVAWMWLKMAIVAAQQLGDGTDSFLLGKLQAAQYFYRWELPKTEHWARRLSDADDTVLETEPDWL